MSARCSGPISGDLVARERQLGDLIAEGELAPTDADAIRVFGEFLNEIGSGPPYLVSMATLRKWQSYMGLSDEQVEAMAQRRGDQR
jgi:hypothetical protein